MRIVLCLFFLTNIVCAQTYNDRTIDLSRIADDLTSTDEDINYEGLYENYAHLLAHPLDLNKASQAELQSLNILKDSEIRQILDYRHQYGNFLSIYELQAVPGLKYDVIEKLAPFVQVADPRSQLDKSILKRIKHKSNTYFLARHEMTLEESKGYLTPADSNGFMGTKDKVYMRFRSSIPHDYSFGFTTEKDGGEQFTWAPKAQQFGTDFWSYHLQVINKKRIKNLIIGDFQSQFGHGLVLGNAFGLGKGAEAVSTIKKPSTGFVPYTSANESGFLRGLAVTCQVQRKTNLSLFYSETRRDASVDESDSPSFTSLNATGLHRTVNELLNKKTIIVRDYGSIINFEDRNINTGIIYHHIDFSLPFIKKDNTYNQFAFEGTTNDNISFYLNYTIRNFTVFGEASKTLKAGTGILGGMLTNLTTKTDVGILFRRYDKNFYTFYGNALSENTLPQNESGIYWGIKHQFNRKLTLTGYVDLFTFPWLKFRTYKPSAGKEILARILYQPTKKVQMYVQCRQESKERNISDTSIPSYVIGEGRKLNMTANFDYQLYTGLKMRSRLQASSYKIGDATSQGMVLLQDVSYSFHKFQITVRHALFDTDDFDNRQYVYENDVWLAYSLPVYYGIGIRNYFLFEYRINKSITFWMRYSRWKYVNKDEIGSGVDVINGNIKSDVKFQARFTI